MSDNGFSASWLDLREPADHQARDKGLLARAAETAPDGSVILDLGSGTGSTARAFNGHLPACTWRFLDGNADLLDIAAERHPGSEQMIANLSDVEAIPLDNVGLVTASALFDLMPETWIETLAARLKSERIPLYAALNYDGRMTWDPALPDDVSITASFNQHQRTDKGLGPATGPTSANAIDRIFSKAGFIVHSADSPWTLDESTIALHDDLLTGIASSADEMGNPLATGWLESRRQFIATASVLVGHTDVLAIPA
ncbi:MAG: class I SAM-dependent methyltransferase [Pseudomonadota bacterium]